MSKTAWCVIAVSLVPPILCTPVTSGALMQYVTAQGGRLGPVAISTDGGLRGLVTTKDVAAGDVLFSIPSSLALVSLDVIENSPARDMVEQLVEHELMAVALLERLRRDDVPKCVVDALPRRFEPGPSWLWSEPELEHLCSPQVAALSRWRHEECRRLHQQIEPLWKASRCCGTSPSFAEVEWAVAIVTSRMLSAASRTGATLPVLLPIADMMNHDDASPGVRFGLEAVEVAVAEEAVHYVCRSSGALARGAPVTFSYDTAAPNAHLLLHFGFVLEDNPNEIVEVDMTEVYEGAPTEAVHRCVHDGLLDGRIDEATSQAQARLRQPLGSALEQAVAALVRASAAEDEWDDADEEALALRGREAYGQLLRRELQRMPPDEAIETGSTSGVVASRVALARVFRRAQRRCVQAALARLEAGCDGAGGGAGGGEADEHLGEVR